MKKELFENEIQLAEDECCIIFDFACYFPYANVEVLEFGFSFGQVEHNDFKLNHRYPNKNYQTISKKYGRQLSKMGYPVVMKLSEQSPVRLVLKVGFHDNWQTTLIFPLLTNMTKERPVCALSLHFNFDWRTKEKLGKFSFISYEKDENGWLQHRWRNYDIEDDVPAIPNDIIFETPDCLKIEESIYTFIYKETITPFSSSLADLIVNAFTPI